MACGDRSVSNVEVIKVGGEAVVCQREVDRTHSQPEPFHSQPVFDSVGVPGHLRNLGERLLEDETAGGNEQHLIQTVDVPRLGSRLAHQYHPVSDPAVEIPIRSDADRAQQTKVAVAGNNRRRRLFERTKRVEIDVLMDEGEDVATRQRGTMIEGGTGAREGAVDVVYRDVLGLGSLVQVLLDRPIKALLSNVGIVEDTDDRNRTTTRGHRSTRSFASATSRLLSVRRLCRIILGGLPVAAPPSCRATG